jgi:hypothetical protein
MTFGLDHIHQIDAPASLVWEVITDFPRYAEWNPFVIGCHSTLAPGESIELRVKIFSKPQNQREWLTEHVPGRRFAYGMKPFPFGALKSERSHDVEELGGGRTRYRSHFELAGWLLPVLRALLGARLEKGFADMSAAIKARAERLARERDPKVTTPR